MNKSESSHRMNTQGLKQLYFYQMKKVRLWARNNMKTLKVDAVAKIKSTALASCGFDRLPH